jgi:hypothetical protein
VLNGPAIVAPYPPFSTKIAMAIFGLSLGAKATNMSDLLVWFSVDLAASFLPFQPQISIPSTLKAAVPNCKHQITANHWFKIHLW